MDTKLPYKIGLGLIPGLGPVVAKKAVAYCGDVEAVFREKRSRLQKIPGIGSFIASSIAGQKVLDRAEKEIEFIERNKIKTLFYLDSNYPERLKHCPDNPLMLFYKGNADLNATRVISVVGTRKATNYGRQFCEKLVDGLRSIDPLIVSGLAYGIDIAAHRASVKYGINTVGILAHGLDRIYPRVHTETARNMISAGGLISEFLSGTNPDRENFPRRNRIIAGMADATIVVEASRKGGALITAEIAHTYNRDVFAVPGRAGDEFSEGCNRLIKQNKAGLIESAEDLIYHMGWEPQEKKKPSAARVIAGLGEEEQLLVNLLREKSQLFIDDLCALSGFTMAKIAPVLLGLEMNGVVKSLPGKMYRLG